MREAITVGMDMGDRDHSLCELDGAGEVRARVTVKNTASALRRHFSKYEPCRVVLEAGTHSGWVSQLLQELGHEVLVGNPRKLRMIWNSDRKDDTRDAEMLARIGRLDPQLLSPIRQRSTDAAEDLAIIKSRDALVRARSALITHARGIVKSSGDRIRSCSARGFASALAEQMPDALAPALEPVRQSIAELSAQIAQHEQIIEALSAQKYPQTAKLCAVTGVGALTALAYVLTLEDPSHFSTSRQAGAFLGLVPRRDQSGQTDKQLNITKAGNAYLRRLLVGAAQYILGPFGPDCDLRRFGLRLAERGGKNAKRRAVVAVARKLAVLLHRLWESDTPYNPNYQSTLGRKRAA